MREPLRPVGVVVRRGKKRDASAGGGVEGERLEHQVRSARIGAGEIGQPLRAAATQVMDDVQLYRS